MGGATTPQSDEESQDTFGDCLIKKARGSCEMQTMLTNLEKYKRCCVFNDLLTVPSFFLANIV